MKFPPLINSLILGFISYLLTAIITPTFINILGNAGFVRANYKGEKIPAGTGMVFVVVSAITVLIAVNLKIVGVEAYVFLFSLGFMGFFGLIDDVFGTRHATGLAGHLKKIVRDKQITTGAMKAIAGGIISIAASLELNNGTFYSWKVIVDAMTLALSTNAINLLDLRPGRAGKGFLILSMFLLIAGTNNAGLLYLIIVLGSLAAMIPLDLRAETMMGDVGSNTLGITVGYTAVTVLPDNLKLIYLCALVLFHLFTERFSLTEIIRRNRVLNYIDMLGRKNLP